MKNLSITPECESAENVIKAAKNVIWKEGKPLPARPEVVKAVWLKGVDYKGKSTKIFAWVGVPKTSNGQKVPGMVLIHGGGGTAFAEWVAMWNRRGYAAIAIDTSGHTPCSSQYGVWPAHEFSGPQNCADFANIESPITDQWTYHAVSAAIIAHSYLLSLPQVDANRTGVPGVRWGGYLTCIAAGVDSRFKVAIPIYGCGFLGDNSMWVAQLNALGEKKRNEWLKLWDPSVYVGNIRIPILWVTSTNDRAYPIDSLKKTYSLLPGKFTLCLPPNFGHSHEIAWGRPEIADFADSILMPEKRVSLPVITGQGTQDKVAWIQFQFDKPIKRVVLCYTMDPAPWPQKRWQTIDIPCTDTKGKVETKIPDGTRAYYFRVIYGQNNCVSSQLQEI